jgi:hypothetical protein
MRRGVLTSIAVSVAITLPAAQRMPDRSFRPMIEDRAYAIGTGPLVCFDESHDNREMLDDGFFPFADLIRRDGYVVRAVQTLDSQSLRDCRIMVIASPRSKLVEAQEIHRWVGGGGSLLLVVDRDSLTAAAELASGFGVRFTDSSGTTARFRTADQTLRPHAIARGRHAKESATSVTTFAGQSISVPATAEPVLAAADGTVHGAVLRLDMGRAAFFGDAALFTAQIVGPDRRLVGMNAPSQRNFQFVLNVMHWLSRVI